MLKNRLTMLMLCCFRSYLVILFLIVEVLVIMAGTLAASVITLAGLYFSQAEIHSIHIIASNCHYFIFI